MNSSYGSFVRSFIRSLARFVDDVADDVTNDGIPRERGERIENPRVRLNKTLDDRYRHFRFLKLIRHPRPRRAPSFPLLLSSLLFFPFFHIPVVDAINPCTLPREEHTSLPFLSSFLFFFFSGGRGLFIFPPAILLRPRVSLPIIGRKADVLFSGPCRLERLIKIRPVSRDVDAFSEAARVRTLSPRNRHRYRSGRRRKTR